MDKNLKNIIEISFSVSDLALKIFGYANGKSIEKSLLILKENGLDKSIFNGKSKNSKYEKIIKICPICSIEFETIKDHKREKIVCSRSCSNSYFKHGINNPNFDKSISDKFYKKISDTVKDKYKKDIIDGNRKLLKNGNSVKLHTKICLNCLIEYKTSKLKQKYCSIKCSMNSEEVKQKFREGIKLRIENGTHKGWTSRNIISYPEKFFREVLENNKIEFEVNKPVKKRDLGIDCDSNYFLDFFIKNGNIDLEVDGKQHSYRKEHDDLRDELLTNNGYNVYRIKWKSINSKNGKDYIKEEIEKFINYYNSKFNI